MLYVTGDTHGQINRFYKKQCPCETGDSVIVCGDFGFVWNEATDDKDLDWLAQKPYNILFVDGNHENFDLLEKYPIKEFANSKARFIRPNIIHLLRGHVYIIEGKKIFSLGGAVSYDKAIRTEFINWWKQEVPSFEEVDYAFSQVDAFEGEVDYIISHDVPSFILKRLYKYPEENFVTKALENIANQFTCDKWYAGHHHLNCCFDGKFQILYNKILKLGGVHSSLKLINE